MNDEEQLDLFTGSPYTYDVISTQRLRTDVDLAILGDLDLMSGTKTEYRVSVAGIRTSGTVTVVTYDDDDTPDRFSWKHGTSGGTASSKDGAAELVANAHRHQAERKQRLDAFHQLHNHQGPKDGKQ